MSEQKEPTILELMQEKQLGYLAGLLEMLEERIIDDHIDGLLEDEEVNAELAKTIQECFYDYYPELEEYIKKIPEMYGVKKDLRIMEKERIETMKEVDREQSFLHG